MRVFIGTVRPCIFDAEEIVLKVFSFCFFTNSDYSIPWLEKKLVHILGSGVEISGALTWPSQTRPTRQEGHLKCPFFRSVQFESCFH